VSAVPADAARAAAEGGLDGPVHYVGCERACGRPRHGQVLIATPDGYRRAPDATGLG
jgi:precorrin-3B synthase